MGLLIPNAPSVLAPLAEWEWHVNRLEGLLVTTDGKELAYPVLAAALKSARNVLSARREHPLPANQETQMDKINLEQFKLCYVEGDTAYFTSGEVKDTWGDDWNDAPYEHNAETPYEPRVRHTNVGAYLPAAEWKEGGVPRWQILRVKFSGFEHDVTLPHEGYPEERCWSVEEINQGKVPWFRVWQWSREGASMVDKFDAGNTYPRFIEFVARFGGLVWVPIEGIEAAISPKAEPGIAVKP